MSGNTVLTVPLTRPVYAHELRPGDVFTFPDAPITPLFVADRTDAPVTPDLALVHLTLLRPSGQVHLPARLRVRPIHMVRTVTLTCLVCRRSRAVELDLPRDGDPLSLVCGRHLTDGEATR